MEKQPKYRREKKVVIIKAGIQGLEVFPLDLEDTRLAKLIKLRLSSLKYVMNILYIEDIVISNDI
ncbi:MAG: hypothetical protein EAX91_16105 [Candidatus Lokiarchaeota archaeon]|nr:hypothetical protein [Candidatus Lokiarchaeota archaeon]